MPRIDWIVQRLENWSRWCLQQDSNGLGYPKQAAFARLGGKGSRGECVIPINNIEASETDQGVKALQWTQSNLYLVLTLTYAKGLPRHLVAKRMCVDERTVRANLERADHALARWLDDRKAQRAAVRASSFQSSS